MPKLRYDSNSIDAFSVLFKALSNPHRLNIFLYLAKSCVPGERSTDAEMRATVGELGDRLEIVPSTVSHHLKELRQSGLIRMERSGKTIECWVDPKTLQALARFFEKAGQQ